MIHSSNEILSKTKVVAFSMRNNFHVQIFSSFHTKVEENLNSNSNRLITYFRRDFKLTFDLSLKRFGAWNEKCRIRNFLQLSYSKFFTFQKKILRKNGFWLGQFPFSLSFYSLSLSSLSPPLSHELYQATIHMNFMQL